MVEDVLQVLAAHSAIDKVVVVSDDPAAELLAEHYQVDYWPEQSLPGSGLNAVVTAFAKAAQLRGVASLLVVHGDLPLLSAGQIDSLLASHAPAPAVTVAPDRHQQGTNCLLCSPPTVIDFFYGDNSLQKHRRACRDSGATWSQLMLDGIACDIDNPEDLLVLLAQQQTGKKSIRYLHETGIAARLQAMSIGSNALEPFVDRDDTL
jgi:2-phospho-L-lactate guanylyltransferase